MIVASFWVYRPEEFPAAADYPAMLRVLQRSCDRLGLKHVVLTDRLTFDSPKWPAGVKGWALTDCPKPLMRAVTEVQARFLESGCAGVRDDVAFVGADCIVKQRLRFNFIPPADLYVTYRTPTARYPINTGLQFVPAASVAKVAPLFRRVADRCGVKWCDDQRAIRAELEPMPRAAGMHARAGLTVGFMPMRPYNVTPRGPDDPCRTAFMVHFRGKGRKGLFFEWAQRNGYA